MLYVYDVKFCCERSAIFVTNNKHMGEEEESQDGKEEKNNYFRLKGDKCPSPCVKIITIQI